jgi:hypothetical protein
MSFRLSIQTEVNWDRMIAEYSIDTGATWQKLGVLNDPAGINWYGGAYANAAGSNIAPDCWDNVTAIAKGFPGDGSGANPPPAWTSNGDCLADDPGGTGPTGYVLVALDLAGHPVLGKSYVRFRFSAFTDGSTHGDGWAIDDFVIGAGPSSTPADYSGKVYDDMDGDGSFGGGDVALSGVTVTMTYYGGAHSTAVTNGSGDYVFDNLTPANSDMYFPGEYNATTALPGVNTDAPSTTVYTGDGTPSSGNNLGYYVGSISGKKYNDKNNNGTLDGGEVGLAGWMIELHADSCNGALIDSAVTDANGVYTINVLPGTYYVNERNQSGYRQTEPDPNCVTVTTSGLSGSGTAIVTGVNFGNYALGTFTIQKFVDLNGDGIADLGDVTAMGLGSIAIFDIKKNGSHLFYDTLGNGTGSVIHQNVDTGNYSVQEIATSPLWIRTFPVSDTYNFTIDTSGSLRTFKFMNYKLSSVSGTKWDDLNGNGVKDTLEPGLSGWTISMSGTMLGAASTVTDVDGNYTIDSIGGGNHTQSEVLQSGWTQTAPVGGTYSYTGGGTLFSGSVVTGKNFGNFKNICISGTKYRDRNGDGDRDAGEEGLSGWKINITGTGGGSVTTDSLGNYSLCGVSTGSHTVTEVGQAGWTLTDPIGGSYVIAAVSGTDATARNFGNFQSSDSTTKYRTFGNIDWVTFAQVTKIIKPPKVGKPATFPNLATLVNDYILQMLKVTDALRVGQLVPLTKKPYLQAKGYKEVMETFWKKGNVHTKTITRPFDINNKGKLMEKRLKALPSTVQNNGLAKELLALAVNIALSDKGKTTPGLGELIYDDGATEDDGTFCPGFPLNGHTLREILAIANNLMTNYSGVSSLCYTRLMEVVSASNNAFSCGAAVCGGASAFTYDTAAWVAGTKLHITGGFPVIAVSFLQANPGAEPYIVPDGGPIATVPDQYSLYQNYPNPFNPTTSIEFDLPQDAFVTLKIFNVLGQEVATLLNHEGLSAGSEGVDFDASMLPSGVYFYRIVAEGVNDDGQITGQTFTQVKKMMLMK